MNTDTGQIYRNLTEEDWARIRTNGEPVVPVSERVADAVEIGMQALNRAERRAQQYQKNARRERTGHQGQG
jgi:hypothetical protein